MFKISILGVLLGAALLLGGPARADNAKHFPPAVQLGGQTLQMNGQGTRHKAVFKLYDMALYLPTKTGDPSQVLSMPGAKRASFVALRDIPGDSFGLSLVRGMRDNVDPQRVTEVVHYMNEIIAVFNTERTIKAGQTFRLDYVPGKGLAFYLDDVQKGPMVANPDFAEAVFSIWMGPRPVDQLLKDQLLGKAAPQAGAHSMN